MVKRGSFFTVKQENLALFFKKRSFYTKENKSWAEEKQKLN